MEIRGAAYPRTRGRGVTPCRGTLTELDQTRLFAPLTGIRGLRVEHASELRAALSQALAADEPVLVDVIVQPLEETRAPVSKWVA